jgi:hypothetical protein
MGNKTLTVWLNDALGDSALCMCSLAGFGLAWKVIFHMAQAATGKLVLTTEQACRLFNCLPAEYDSALTEIEDNSVLHVTRNNGVVTLVHRRMSKDAKTRMQTRERVNRHREKERGCNGDVTPSRARTHGDGEGSCSASDIPPSPSPSEQQQQQLSRETVTGGWPEWITAAEVYEWFRDRLKSDAAATDLADRWMEFNSHIDRWRHATPANWRYFCARFLSEEIRRNGHPDKRYFQFRDQDERQFVETMAAEQRADAETVSAALAEMRKACGGGR